MILELPDCRQGDALHTCGDVVLRVVWQLFGVKGKAPAATPVDGLSPDTLESLLWRSGLVCQAGTMDAEDLRYHTSRGRPVICCVTEADGVGHWLVVAGVGRAKVHYQCPLGGPKREGIESFLARWTDGTRRGETFARWGIAVSKAE